MEIGVGHGFYLAVAMEKFRDSYFDVVDISRFSINLARSVAGYVSGNYSRVHYHHKDIFEFDPPAQSYDYVLLSGALNEEMDDGGEYAD